MSICKWCGLEIPTNMASYHSRTCEMNPNHEKNITVLRNNAIKTTHIVLSNGGYAQYKPLSFRRQERIIVCSECGSEFKVICSDYQFKKGKYRHYCSRSCANKRTHSDETKQKISNSIIKRINAYKKLYTCGVCGSKYHYTRGTSTKKFCSKECAAYYKEHRKEFLSCDAIEKLSAAGKKSAFKQRNDRRSKNEKLFCELCEHEFNNVIHNVPMFNGWDADVILTDQKIAVLWNGKWHYENIMKGVSLEQIQNRDNIKIKEIEKAGYIPYIIKDYGKHNSSFVKEQFSLFKEFINDFNKEHDQ